jgi:hypothetical protein
VRVVKGDPSKPEIVAAALHVATAVFLHPRAVGDAAADLVALAGELARGELVALVAGNIDDDLPDQPSCYRGDRLKNDVPSITGSAR